MQSTHYKIIGKYQGKQIISIEIEKNNIDNALLLLEESFNLWYPRYTDSTNGNYNFRMPKDLKFSDLKIYKIPFVYGYSNQQIFGDKKEY